VRGPSLVESIIDVSILWHVSGEGALPRRDVAASSRGIRGHRGAHPRGSRATRELDRRLDPARAGIGPEWIDADK
jgi:hypothetical protein